MPFSAPGLKLSGAGSGCVKPVGPAAGIAAEGSGCVGARSAAEQSLDFLARTKNADFPNRKPLVSHSGFPDGYQFVSPSFRILFRTEILQSPVLTCMKTFSHFKPERRIVAGLVRISFLKIISLLRKPSAGFKFNSVKFISAGLWLPRVSFHKSKECSTGRPSLPYCWRALCMEVDMFISAAITYLILAIISGVLGFGMLSEDAASIAKAAFFVFLVAFGVSLLMTGQPEHRKNI